MVGYGEYRAQARAGRERHDRNTEVQLCTRNDVLFFSIILIGGLCYRNSCNIEIHLSFPVKECEILRLFAIFWRASLNLHGAHPLGNARQHDQLAPHSQFLRRRRLSTMVLGYPTSDEQPRSELPWVGCKARFV